MKKIISIILSAIIVLTSFSFSINTYATNYGAYCSNLVEYPNVNLPAFSEYIKGNSSNTEATSVLLYSQNDSSFYFCSGTVRNTKCKLKIENGSLKFYETGGYQYSFSIYKYTPNVSDDWTLVNSGSGSWDFNETVVAVSSANKIKFLWTKYDTEYFDETAYTIYSNNSNTYENGIFACYYSSTGSYLNNDPNSKTYFSGSFNNSIGSVVADSGMIDDNGEEVDNFTVTGNDSSRNKSTRYNQVTISSNQTAASTDVYGTIAESNIKVSYPTVLILDSEPVNGEYLAYGVVKVKGDISGKTRIHVEPQDEINGTPGINFEMVQTGKNAITATVIQPYTEFAVATSTSTGDNLKKGVTTEFNNTAVSNITVKATGASAGAWYGDYDTIISLSVDE